MGDFRGSGVGKYGQMWLDNLEENKPDLYAEYQRQGTLVAEARAVEESASGIFETPMSELTRQHPFPDGSLQRVQHAQVLMNMAREIAIEASGVQVMDAETEQAMTDGYR